MLKNNLNQHISNRFFFKLQLINMTHFFIYERSYQQDQRDQWNYEYFHVKEITRQIDMKRLSYSEI